MKLATMLYDEHSFIAHAAIFLRNDLRRLRFHLKNWNVIVILVFLCICGDGQAQSCDAFAPLTNGEFENSISGWAVFDSDAPVGVASYTTGRNSTYALQLNVSGMSVPVKSLATGPMGGSHYSSGVVWLLDGFQSADGFHAYIGGEYYMLRTEYRFKKGRTYKGSIYLKSPNNVTVEFIFRRAAGAQEAFAVRRVTVGPNWQQVEIQGGFDALGADGYGCIDGYVEIYFLTSGTLIMDNATIADVTTATLTQAVPGGAIPSTFFGLHINKFGTTQTNRRPPIGFGLLRLWDTATRWLDLETSNNSWSWNRINGLVDLAEEDSPTEILYTLGMTPKWAAKYPAQPGTYGEGSASAPTNIADWIDYVSTVGNEFDGRIKYYEIWNEADYNGFWRGNVKKMVELNSAAYTTLKAIDGDIQVLSPNITTLGLSWLEEFLAEGGGDFVDIYSYHYYPTGMIEDGIPVLEGMKWVLDRYPSEANKPIWNTEGANVFPTNELSTSLENAAVARSYIVQWIQGIENFSWYMWENQQAPGVRTNPSLSKTTDAWVSVDTTTAGHAYRNVRDWLVGSSVTARTVTGSTWKVEIEKSNDDMAWIVWTTNGAQTVQVPGWGTTRVTDLGNNDYTTSDQTIPIGTEPILVEPSSNDAPSGRIRLNEEEKIVTSVETDISETIFQVYPNTTNGKVTIEYDLAEETAVNISIRDSFGRTIAELVNGHQSPGQYSTTFNGEGISSGIYFCESRTNKVRTVTKIIVMR